MVNFKQLKIWQKGVEIATNSFKFTKELPTEYQYSLGQQINRSALSIPSNIAEGSGRFTEKEYSRFLDIALGLAFELETQLIISQAVGVGDVELRNSILSSVREEQKMIYGFKRTLQPMWKPS